jgi:hypothetical protein
MKAKEIAARSMLTALFFLGYLTSLSVASLQISIPEWQVRRVMNWREFGQKLS